MPNVAVVSDTSIYLKIILVKYVGLYDSSIRGPRKRSRRYSAPFGGRGPSGVGADPMTLRIFKEPLGAGWKFQVLAVVSQAPASCLGSWER